ncbi:D-glycero-alpha-D-manno-heptose-1,7-bisphosphate 7-phosphatase [Streptomyces sp. NPDC020898]|uniref:D-glycero-alpha-D-manno-heptose-1,7-bisphosphate 7-phosphatase n=1 Tax=Streptomyces sp. NPDC020898 TaxID=3365101 RepID=UPI00378BC002
MSTDAVPPIVIRGAGPSRSMDEYGPGEPGLLCDRDGTIIENRAEYVLRSEDIRILPGAVDALRDAVRAGFTIGIISNQSPVGRGLLTVNEAVSLHQELLARLAAADVPVAASYLCPHRPEHRCHCRKPEPALIRRAVTELRLDPARTWYVGDAAADALAARTAGVHGALVRTGRGAAESRTLDRHGLTGLPVVDDLAAAVELAGRRLRAAGEPAFDRSCRETTSYAE